MKNTILKAQLFLMAICTVIIVSCSAEDGEDGAVGQQGIAGTDGINGVDGTNGADGEDGNANVSVITKDISSASGTYVDVEFSELTQDVIVNDVVLGYVKRSDSFSWHPLPSISDNLPFSIAVYLSQDYYSLDFVDRTDGSAYTISENYLDVLKVVIIEATSSTTGKSKNSKNVILDKLTQEGVDINNYYSVCDYYGIPY